MTDTETMAALEEVHAKQISELGTSHRQAQLDTLTTYAAMLAAVDDPKIFNDIFGTNNEFVSAFGDQPDAWAKNINTFVEHEKTA